MILSVKKLIESDSSFPELAFPTYRKNNEQSVDGWIAGKVYDDGAEGIWRIHDRLYDFSNFVNNHPGGKSWLTMTKGTDITEAFETHHISRYPEQILSKFYVRDAKTPRYSPYTFKEDGFYRVLKENVRNKLKGVSFVEYEKRTRAVMDVLVLSLMVCSGITCLVENILVKGAFCFISGILMAWSVNCAHNFMHKKDNWRMHFIGLSFLSVREWRVMHAFSHHLYPNTLLDLEMYLFEPFFVWMPRKNKTFLLKYTSRIYAVFVYLFINDGQLINRITGLWSNKYIYKFEWNDLVPFMVPTVMFIISRAGIKEVLIVWTIIWHLSSLINGIINLHAAHHHPEIFHDGDIARKDRDWGLHQLDAVADRIEINNSFFMVVTHFGEHVLHHMFPTLDHSILSMLHPVFVETCQQFKSKIYTTNQLDMFFGYYRQLAKTEPKDFNIQNDETKSE